VNPHVGMPVARGFADGFGNANADALRFRAGNRSRLPSSPAEEDVFRVFYEDTGERWEVRRTGRTVELVENAQQLGLVQGQRYLLGTTYPQEHLLHFVQTRGNGLKKLPAAVRGEAQTAQATLDLLKLLGDIDLRFRRSLWKIIRLIDASVSRVERAAQRCSQCGDPSNRRHTEDFLRRAGAKL
jgi:hypothetical protein